MNFGSQPLGIFSLIAILVCLAVIWVCNRILQKKEKKTLARVYDMLDQEAEKED